MMDSDSDIENCIDFIREPITIPDNIKYHLIRILKQDKYVSIIKRTRKLNKYNSGYEILLHDDVFSEESILKTYNQGTKIDINESSMFVMLISYYSEKFVKFNSIDEIKRECIDMEADAVHNRVLTNTDFKLKIDDYPMYTYEIKLDNQTINGTNLTSLIVYNSDDKRDFIDFSYVVTFDANKEERSINIFNVSSIRI